MTEIMKEIEADMTAVSSWLEQTDAILKSRGARAFSGHGAKFAFLVASFPIEGQGFPKGSLGYDGTASCSSVVVRLTRELAEKAYKLAVGGS